MSNRMRWAVALAVLCLLSGLSTSAREPLTFEERVKAQEAIERVYYAKRIWPKENPGPKPPFEQMVPRAQIEAKVADYLKKSVALGQFWQRPIGPSQLQAEMERMAKGSQDPATLQELFAALGNDPYLIAECLARPALAERLIRNWYACDERIHGETRKRAEAAVEKGGEGLPFDAAEPPTRRTLVRGSPGALEGGPGALGSQGEWVVPPKRFERELELSPPAGGGPSLRETAEAYFVVKTLQKTADRLESETQVYPKRALGEWLRPFSAIQKMTGDGAQTAHRYLLPATSASGCSDGWQNGILEDMPDERAGHTAVWTGTEMIVWGGGGHFNTGGRYDPATDVWTSTSTEAGCPSGRHGHTAVWTGTEMIIWGGTDDLTSYGSGGRYDPAGDTWVTTREDPSSPQSRAFHTAVWTGTEMVVWGGAHLWAPPYADDLSSGGRYDPSTDEWTPTNDWENVPLMRRSHTAVWTGGEMIVWGGRVSSGGSYEYLDTGARYRPADDSWTPLPAGGSCPPARFAHTATWTGSEMIVWGGADAAGSLNTGAQYSPSADTWAATSLGSACPSARDSHSAVWTGTEMVIWGGRCGDSTPYLDSGARYNPSTGVWTPTSWEEDSPSGRYAHTAVWTGSEMIVWGGDDLEHVNTGGRYSPSSDTWVPTSTGVGAPSSRWDHTAIWTGSEMVVWGGSLNTGGRYTPALDAWMPTSTGANCPSARAYYTAIWTGTAVAIWGGFSGGYLDTGALYNPGADTWEPTPTGGSCPSARAFHTAIWTGTEMVVWGGSTGGGLVNTGGRYAPSTSSWAATNLSGAPTARCNQTAVWSGAEMIVWGGSSSGHLTTGGRYNPSADAWQPISTGPNCPVGRFVQAVWTGQEMLFWGGRLDVSPWYLNTGARYAPSTDTWAATSTGPDCPQARMNHTAVWTGTELVVWGGEASGDYLRSGGRYDPRTDAWVPTDEGSGCPVGREYHKAVWTGTEMIVWGGFDYYSALGSGGRYHPPVSLGPAVTGSGSACAGQSVRLETGVFATYQWMRDGVGIPGATGASYEATESGSYAVTVTGPYGCTETSAPAPVEIWPMPTPSVLGPPSACGTADLSTESAATYQWLRDGAEIPGATGQNYAATVSGMYSVRVVTSRGCAATSPERSVAVHSSPTPAVSGPAPACGAASLSTGTFASYQWHRNGAVIPGATAQAYDAVAPGAYTVAVADSNGCVGTSPSFVVHSPPAPQVFSGTETCWAVTLYTTLFASYQWNFGGVPIPGATAQAWGATAAGDYTVTVTDANGCTATSPVRTLEFQPPPAPVVAGAHFNVCPETAVTLSVSGSYAYYQWRLNGISIPGANGPTLPAGVTGSYHVAVTDAAGCWGGSPEHMVFVDFCAQSEVSPAGAVFPARLEKSESSPTGYYLTFQRLDTLDGYNIYEGDAGTWYSHGGAAGNGCAAAVEDLGTGEMRAAIAPGEGDRYYVVTAFGGGAEGPSGFSSLGTEIPASQSTCAP